MIPTSLTFGIFLNYGNKGVWLGVPVGASIQMFSYFYIFFNAPWKKIAEIASIHEHRAIVKEIPLEALMQNDSQEDN